MNLSAYGLRPAGKLCLANPNDVAELGKMAEQRSRGSGQAVGKISVRSIESRHFHRVKTKVRGVPTSTLGLDDVLTSGSGRLVNLLEPPEGDGIYGFVRQMVLIW